MGASVDKRTEANILVKKNLSDALFALLEEKGIGSVGISELVSRAGVSRSSFYRNFDSVDDVMVYGSELLKEKFYATCPYQPLDFTDVECVDWLLAFLQAHASQIVTLSHSGLAHASFGQRFEIGMYGLDEDECGARAIAERRFAIGAFHAVALHWLEDDAPGNREELAQLICDMLVNGIVPEH